MNSTNTTACLVLASVVSLGQLLLAEDPIRTGDRRMNVLFIVCDDLNTRLNCYGFKPVQTPALDRLCSEGIRFDRAYCQYPVCNPSRSSFLTGLRPETTMILDNQVRLRDQNPTVVTLPECFRQQGYWTAGIGKIFHDYRTDNAESWNEFEKTVNERNPVIEAARRQFEAKHGSIHSEENRQAWNKIRRSPDLRKRAGAQTPAGVGPTDMTDEEHADGKSVRRIIQWLESKAFGDRPFFISCGIAKPHVPFWAPQEYFDLYPTGNIELVPDPASDWDDIPEIALWGRYRVFFPTRNPTAETRREAMAAYYACATFVDTQVGLLFEALRRLDLWDNTIIVFTSDHGYHLGEHGMWGKVTLFEECDRVPLVLRVPGKTEAGSVCPRLVELVDLYPTLTDLCSTRAPDNLEGSSFAPLLADPDRPWKKAAFTIVNRGPEMKQTGRAVRTERWRYAEWDDPEINELYDLTHDQREWTNLSKDPHYAARVGEMRSLLNGGWKNALPPE